VSRAAAGIAGLIKTAVSLRQPEAIAASLHAAELQYPAIDWDEIPYPGSAGTGSRGQLRNGALAGVTLGRDQSGNQRARGAGQRC